ncbi:hypothetical protein PG993_011166 [Apiospora rasikravindrae]|uniref:C2H2-type domain-containing protein n=1 Tax=Apiospora rasikravindrae TaxID=990691 RepID=A0ABR1SDH8_9PEZI
MVSTKESRSSVDFDQISDKELPAHSGFAYEQNWNQINQIPPYYDYSSESNELPTFSEVDYYGEHSTSHQPSLYAPGDNEGAFGFAAPSAGDPCLFGIGSNFGGDPSNAPPIPGFEPSTEVGYSTSPGQTYGASCDQSFPVHRSRDVYRRTLLGIPYENGQEGYHQHSSDSSHYHGSSSNLGGGGGNPDLGYLTPLSPISTAQPSSSGASRARRPRKPPDSARRYKCTVSDCLWSFDQPKGLKRHMESKHADLNTAYYICKCSYQTSIKSNYQRHLKNRRGRCGHDDVWSGFICKCGCASFEDLEDQLKHLDNCDAVKERVGRPPKIA